MKKILLFILSMILGIAIIIYGGYDDSPGAQGIGLLMVFGGIWTLIPKRRKEVIIISFKSFKYIKKENKRIIYLVIITGAFLLIPLILTLINPNATINGGQGGGWDWTLSDFVIAGVFLFGSGLVYELISRRSNNVIYKAGVGVAVVTALLLAWVNGAVGIIGNEDNPANALYGGVLLIGVAGASIARLKPKGMAVVLYITAFAQMLVPAIAYIFWPPNIASWSPSVPGVFVLSGFFATLFIVSASLFLRASEKIKL